MLRNAANAGRWYRNYRVEVSCVFSELRRVPKGSLLTCLACRAETYQALGAWAGAASTRQDKRQLRRKEAYNQPLPTFLAKAKDMDPMLHRT